MCKTSEIPTWCVGIATIAGLMDTAKGFFHKIVFHHIADPHFRDMYIESPALFENPIKPRVYVSIMYQSPHCLCRGDTQRLGIF